MNAPASFLSEKPRAVGGSAGGDTVVTPCFTPGTLIKTMRGEVAVEDLAVGDKVLTRDNGFQVIRWIGSRTLSREELAAQPDFNPIEIAKGALGGGMPERTMRLSPQHRVLIEGGATQMFFGTYEVLVPAAQLLGMPGVTRVEPEEVTYIHLLFDRHEIISGDGFWSESFQPSDHTLAGLDSDARDEILALFPELAQIGGITRSHRAARMTVCTEETPVLARLGG